jgi:hypothetical protein
MVATLVPGKMAAAFPSSRLVYTRGAGAAHCPNEAALRQTVAKRLGYDPFFPSAARTIVASVVLDNERLRAQAQLVDEQGIVRGSREYFARPDHCEDLIHALALSISISIDPASVDPRDPPTAAASSTKVHDEPVPPPASAPPAAVDSTNLLRQANEDRSARVERNVTFSAESAQQHGLRWGVGLGTRLSLRASPGPTLGGALSLLARWSRWSGVAELGTEWPTSAELDTGEAPVRIRASHSWVALAPCGHWEPFYFCGLLTAARFSVHRADFDAIGETQTVAASGGRVGIEKMLTETFGFRLEGDLLATLIRTPVTLQGREVWRAPPWSTAFSIALVAHFP